MITKHEQAMKLAEEHYGVEDAVRSIYRIVRSSKLEEEDPAEPVKLLEVNEYALEAGVMPLRFGASPESGFPYSMTIVEVSPDELERIRRGQLTLPSGWAVGDLLPRSNGNGSHGPQR